MRGPLLAYIQKEDQMTVARHYRMVAAQGKGAELLAALTALVQALNNIPGFEGVDLLRDIEDGDKFIFIEKWSSVEAHKSAALQLHKDTFAPVAATLAGRPDGSYLDYQPTA